MLKNSLSKFALFALLTFPQITQAAATDLPVIETAKLSLSAQAVLYKPADELQIKIGVVTLANTAEEALRENSSKMQDVTDSLEKIGLTKEEYETGHFSIQPTYTPWPQNPPADWKQTINGYEVKNSLAIRTPKMDIAGKLIDTANKAGANSISDINFGLHDARIYWKEALAAATINAIDDAQAIALAAGVQLGRALSISLNSTNVSSHNVNSKYLMQAMSAGVETPIEPGEVNLTASVSIVYEIIN